MLKWGLCNSDMYIYVYVFVKRRYFPVDEVMSYDFDGESKPQVWEVSGDWVFEVLYP
jgi:hypothetical protein